MIVVECKWDETRGSFVIQNSALQDSESLFLYNYNKLYNTFFLLSSKLIFSDDYRVEMSLLDGWSLGSRPRLRCSIVIYCRMSREISWACEQQQQQSILGSCQCELKKVLIAYNIDVRVCLSVRDPEIGIQWLSGWRVCLWKRVRSWPRSIVSLGPRERLTTSRATVFRRRRMRVKSELTHRTLPFQVLWGAASNLITSPKSASLRTLPTQVLELNPFTNHGELTRQTP